VQSCVRTLHCIQPSRKSYNVHSFLTKPKNLSANCTLLPEYEIVKSLCLSPLGCWKATYFFQQIKASNSVIKLLTDVTDFLGKFKKTKLFLCQLICCMRENGCFHFFQRNCKLRFCCRNLQCLLTRIELAYGMFVLWFRPKKQQFSVALPTP